MAELNIPDEMQNILEDPKLLELINDEFSKKIVGEEKTRRGIFLSLCSIWVKNPQTQVNTLVNSESSAGKSYICKKVFDIFPANLKEYRTKISPEAFTYWKARDPNWNWDGKVCYLEDISQLILDSDTFKVMCSEGSTATIVRNQTAIDINIKGKPSMLITTATTNPNNEVLNRFSIITLDESEAQTEAILQEQSKEAEFGFKLEYDPQIIKALSYLQRINIKIPYASKINNHFFSSASKSLRVRRDYIRFLDLIKSSCALHQYQRDFDTNNDCFLANEEDYNNALEILSLIKYKSVFGLPNRLRKAYDSCILLYEQKGSFTNKEIYTFAPFVNQRMWWDYLDKLTTLKILSVDLEKKENSDKHVKVYTPIKLISTNLPNFQYLTTNTTTATITTNSTNTTNPNLIEERFSSNGSNSIKLLGGKPIKSNLDDVSVITPESYTKLIFTQLYKPIAGDCYNCKEREVLQWQDQDHNQYCAGCKKKLEMGVS